MTTASDLYSNGGLTGSDLCPCGGEIRITTANEFWEGYCTRCGVPVYLDDSLEWVFLIAAYVEIPV